MRRHLREHIKKEGEITDKKYWKGSRYGNDTIWRKIIDLNRIMIYADQNGIMTDKVQRK